MVKQIYSKWAPIAWHDRHLYIAGAGTSGRLGLLNTVAIHSQKQFILDADIAGGTKAFYRAVEGAEDNENLAQKDIIKKHMTGNDVIFGVSASGRTPYVMHYLKMAKNLGALTVGIDNSPQSALSLMADCTISNNTGSEYPRGSTRMKSGTSQHLTLQLLLNLLSEPLSDRKTDELSKKFDARMDTIEQSLRIIESNASSIMADAKKLVLHFMDLQHKKGRIIYVGKGVRGLFGVIDGAELLPTYSWSRVAYVVPDLSDLLGEKLATPNVGPHDFVIATDLSEKFSCPYIDLSKYDTFSLCIVLKLISTLFALQSGWILEGEMIALDPKNPNKKLKARRIQILKNLGIAHTDEEALKILQKTNQDLTLAVKRNYPVYQPQ